MSINRRQFLKIGVAGGAGAAVAGTWISSTQDGHGAGTPLTVTPGARQAEKAAPTVTRAPRPGGRAAERALVVVELQGGNDGPSTVIPMNQHAALRRLRSRTLPNLEASHAIAGGLALHPGLERLHRRGVAAVVGVGTPHPDGSHFEMMRRWWQGDPDGKQTQRGGFLGRVCDVIGDPQAPAVGVSVNSGSTMALASSRVSTLPLPDLSAIELFRRNADDQFRTAFQAGFELMVEAGATGLAAVANEGGRRAVAIARKMDEVQQQGGQDESEDGYPGDGLAQALKMGARLLAANVGVRVLHVSIGGFDTHGDHVNTHNELMDELDRSLDAFLADLERRGMHDRTLVATTSEFGRRVEDNGNNGLDHGAASVALLLGPVKAGVYGTYPSLTSLDADDNLKVTVAMHEYYATLAAWLGVAPDEVLPYHPSPVALPF